ncbi:MAG: DNRLRE domain-containing protein [Bacteroidia bacterium]
MKQKLHLRFTFILIIVTACLFNTVAQINTWHQKASYPNSGRYASLGFSIGQYGYIGGGYNGSNFDDFWQYDPVNNTWTQKSNLPAALRIANSFVINNFGYITGGIDNSSNKNFHLWQYDPNTNNWIAKADFPGVPRYGAAGFTIGSKGYFGIGNTGSATGPYYNDFYEYDPNLNSWTQKASFPGTSRYGVYGTSSNSYGYVGFGVNENSGSLFNDWWQYDPLNDSWNAKANYPATARTSPRGFVINNVIYLGTGQDLSVQYNDFYEYDEVNNNWISKASYSGGNRWLCVGFAIGNNGYLGTGYANSLYYNDFWEYSADTTASNDTCITIKPNATDGKDINVLSGFPTTNFDPYPGLVATAWTCGGSPCNNRALIQFDLSVLPANAVLSHAGLNFYANPNPMVIPLANYGTDNACWIQRISTTWNEQFVTWNSQPSTVTLHQVQLPQSTSSNQDYTDVDVTTLVQDMINDPTNSFGFLLRLVNENYYNGRDFASSDNPVASKWPSITLCYSIPQGINDTKNNIGFVNIFPNPINSEFQVELQFKNNSEVTIEMIDVLGKILYTKSYFQFANGITVNKISTEDVPALNQQGIYFVKITAGNEVVTQKIVKTN